MQPPAIMETISTQAAAAGISAMVMAEAGLCLLFPPNTDGRPVFVSCGRDGGFPEGHGAWLSGCGYLAVMIETAEEGAALLDVLARYGAPTGPGSP